MRWLTSDLPEERKLFETNPAPISGLASKVGSAAALAALFAAIVIAAISQEWIVVACLVLTFVFTVATPLLFAAAVAISALHGAYLIATLIVVGLTAGIVSRALASRNARRLGYDL